MVLFALQLRAEMDGLRALCPPQDWIFTLRQSGGTEEREGVVIRADEEVEVSGSRGVANFVIKFGKSEATVSVASTAEVSAQEAESDYVTIAEFECRGVEPTVWHFHETTTFTAVTENDIDVGDVDLAEGDWYDVDEDGNSFGISSLEYRFVTVKQGKKKKKKGGK